MTDWRQIAIDLYRDGMPKQTIREKLDMSASELNSYLVGEPARKSAPPVRGMSPAKQAAFKMLNAGWDVESVHKRLAGMGFTVARSTVAKWRCDACGPVNNRIDSRAVAEIVSGYPDASCYEVASIYAMRTGNKASHQSIDYWLRKMKKATEAA